MKDIDQNLDTMKHVGLKGGSTAHSLVYILVQVPRRADTLGYVACMSVTDARKALDYKDHTAVLPEL